MFPGPVRSDHERKLTAEDCTRALMWINLNNRFALVGPIESVEEEPAWPVIAGPQVQGGRGSGTQEQQLRLMRLS
jgi:hypothetical protein